MEKIPASIKNFKFVGKDRGMTSAIINAVIKTDSTFVTALNNLENIKFAKKLTPININVLTIICLGVNGTRLKKPSITDITNNATR